MANIKNSHQLMAGPGALVTSKSMSSSLNLELDHQISVMHMR